MTLPIPLCCSPASTSEWGLCSNTTHNRGEHYGGWGVPARIQHPLQSHIPTGIEGKEYNFRNIPIPLHPFAEASLHSHCFHCSRCFQHCSISLKTPLSPTLHHR